MNLKKLNNAFFAINNEIHIGRSILENSPSFAKALHEAYVHEFSSHLGLFAVQHVSQEKLDALILHYLSSGQEEEATRLKGLQCG